VLIVAAAAVLAAVFASRAAPEPHALLIGLTDDAQILGNPARSFPLLQRLHVRIVRVNLRWDAVARRRPSEARNPQDRAYNWRLYDEAASRAAKSDVKLLFTIVGSPRWASGFAKPNHAPKRFADLEDFAFAAATRYADVHLWSAWNEPNYRVFLRPQYRRAGGRWVIQSAIDYAQICTAIYQGVHAAQQDTQVACGETDPNGNDEPESSRPAVAPLTFLRALKAAGLKQFDAWAHHPYAEKPSQAPWSRPKNKTVALGNLDLLVKELTKLYGPKPVWLTEYGYQTSPPDPRDGVSWRRQAQYLTNSYAIVRRNPRVEMLVWFLIRDEARNGGWQSGLETSGGRKKPAFDAFRRL
jgi:hypothetical protein